MLELQKEAAAEANMAAPAATTTTTEATADASPSFTDATTTPEEKERKKKEYAAAQQGAMRDAVGTLLGSTNGKALRGVLKDLDTPDLIWKLGSLQGRPIVKLGTETILNKFMFSRFRRKTKKNSSGSNNKSGQQQQLRRHEEEENYRPVSEECKALRDRQARRTKQVTRFLLRNHAKRCLFRIKGITGIVRLALSALQITLSIVLSRTLQKSMPRLGGRNDSVVAPAAASIA